MVHKFQIKKKQVRNIRERHPWNQSYLAQKVEKKNSSRTKKKKQCFATQTFLAVRNASDVYFKMDAEDDAGMQYKHTSTCFLLSELVCRHNL